MRNPYESHSQRRCFALWSAATCRSRSWLVLVTAVAACLWGCHLQNAYAQGSSLEAPNNLVSDSARATDSDRAIVLHAGKAVRFTISADWHVREVGFGRQVRLLVSPNPIGALARDVEDGLWLALDYRPSGQPIESTDVLSRRVEENLDQILGDGGHATEARILDRHDLIAVRTDFQTMPDRVEGRQSAQPNGAAHKSRKSRGFHALVQTDWCSCQVHATAPMEVADKRFLEFERILDELQLVRPTEQTQNVISSVKDASSILGSWKAHACRIRLAADGTFSVLSDTPFNFTTHRSREQLIGTEISGRFRAQRDLLFIQWDDGSKLNYRWRRHGDRLLMTDHEGRMTRLLRISE